MSILDTGWKSPSSATNDSSIGSFGWTGYTNIYSSNNTYAYYSLSSDENYGFSASDNAVRIVKGGVIGSTDKSGISNWNSTDTVVYYGGPSDLWGESWSASDINSSNFGFAISALESYTFDETYYLKATGFGFSIPSGATIDGIEVACEKHAIWDSGELKFYIRIDHIQIKVYYTEGGTPIIGVKYPLPAFKRS
jgi:hypothetical protein